MTITTIPAIDRTKHTDPSICIRVHRKKRSDLGASEINLAIGMGWGGVEFKEKASWFIDSTCVKNIIPALAYALGSHDLARLITALQLGLASRMESET